MKKFALILISLLLSQQIIFAETLVYSDNNKFGLKDNQGSIITKAKYKKLVRLGTSSWISQERTKFGIIDDNGNIIINPIYNQAERVAGKYVKFRKGSQYCLLNEQGYDIIGNNKNNEKPDMFSSIDLLYGGLIVTSKHHKYGLSSFNGKTKLDNIFDDIYMSDKGTLVIVYGGKYLEFERINNNDSPFNFEFTNLKEQDIKLGDIATSPLATTGYYSITFTDYILKIISSISPAYEETIDELMFSQGADTVSVIMKCSWLPKFPFVYARNYYNTVTDPLNGPLNNTKKNLRKQIKESD